MYKQVTHTMKETSGCEGCRSTSGCYARHRIYFTC